MNGLIHHIELYVSDLERSMAFWQWLLEDLSYHIHQQWPEGISFKLGPSYIVFVQTEDRFLDVPYHRRRTGLNHIAFHASSKSHVDQMTGQLRAANVPILYEHLHPYAGGNEHYAVYFEDPDRIKVELVAPSE
ncbi:VOC family protein [Marinococcus sp. PL1-022]|uniref:VOC family protein n=1 Tax=Marinococcus sp. PL1-022 TaxID=3095363 RepID=UPI0029C3DBBD|nr:VOC family protein [Marinococcus sp. PL1-022]MDX6153147.1 VOC family protein [Marinococcus sp. PL1-022]